MNEDKMPCRTCKHFETHCEFLLNLKGDEIGCDWIPSRYKEKPCKHNWMVPSSVGMPYVCSRCGSEEN